jgi:hypothetical protein
MMPNVVLLKQGGHARNKITASPADQIKRKILDDKSFFMVGLCGLFKGKKGRTSNKSI